jgi:hypothetical protein
MIADRVTEDYNLYGKIKIILITQPDFFWELKNELDNDMIKYDYCINIDLLINSYKYEELYGIMIDDTNSVYKKELYNENIFCKNIEYLFPCLCIKSNNVITLLWTHPKIKRFRFEKKMIEILYSKNKKNIYTVKYDNINNKYIFHSLDSDKENAPKSFLMSFFNFLCNKKS